MLGERSTGTPPAPFGFIESAGFFNDDFRVSHNLTLNLGLRYEYVTVPVGSRYQANDAIASVPGVVTSPIPRRARTTGRRASGSRIRRETTAYGPFAAA